MSLDTKKLNRAILDAQLQIMFWKNEPPCQVRQIMLKRWRANLKELKGLL